MQTEPLVAAVQGTTGDTLRVAFVGEVDHGKSTLLGRILYDTGAVTPDRLEVSAADGGLAFLLDGLSEERDHLFTLDTTQAVVETPRRRFVLIDVPGHAELLKNMASGASRADVGVVVVDGVEGTAAQTLRHLRILELLGVGTCIGAVTKLDLVGYRMEVFAGVERKLAALAGGCGIELAAVVPLSAVAGVNVTAAAPAELPWYAGEPLLSALHTVGAVRERHARDRFVVQAVVGRGSRRRVVGRVESGTVRVGQALVGQALVGGTGQRCTVGLIERFGEPPLPIARAGDSVGLAVTGPEPPPGAVLAPPEQPLVTGRRWHARILVTADTQVAAGDACVVRYSPGAVPGVVERVEQRWDSTTGAPVADPDGAAGRGGGDAGAARFSEIVAVRIRLERAAPAEDIRSCPPLGRFMLCDAEGRAVALGIVDQVEPESHPGTVPR